MASCSPHGRHPPSKGSHAPCKGLSILHHRVPILPLSRRGPSSEGSPVLRQCGDTQPSGTDLVLSDGRSGGQGEAWAAHQLCPSETQPIAPGPTQQNFKGLSASCRDAFCGRAGTSRLGSDLLCSRRGLSRGPLGWASVQ